MKIAFLLLPFVLSTSVHAMTCDLVFNSKKVTNREELIEASKLSTKKPEYTSQKVSDSQKYWSSRITDIKTSEEAIRTLRQIVEGTSVLSTSKWLQVLNEAGPQLLVKLETLDNLGVLDLAVAKDYIMKQTDRMSNFTDGTYVEALNKVFNEPNTKESVYARDAKFNLNEMIDSRNNVQHDFHREYSGPEAKELYSALRIPEKQDASGKTYKVLRSTDRGVIILMGADPKNNAYFVEVKADTKSEAFSSQDSDFYWLSPSRVVVDKNPLVAQSASATLFEANALAHRVRDTHPDTDRRILDIGDAKGNRAMKLVFEQRDINEGSPYSPNYTKKDVSFAIAIPRTKIDTTIKVKQATPELVQGPGLDPVSHIRAVRRGHWVNQFEAAGIFGKTMMMFDREFWEVIDGAPVRY